MKIDRRLNLVIPVEQDDGTIYVHSSPIARAVFDRYFMVIAKTFSSIYNEGLGVTSGPRVAALLLKDTATNLGVWDGEAGVERGLMNEVRRLSNVIMLGPAGWTTIPFQEAVDKKMIDDTDRSEVENAIVFFTVASLMHKKAELPAILGGAVSLWGGQITSSNCTEYASSLPTSTATENSGGTTAGSSVPS